MSLLMPERLYQLLPAVYRDRDVSQGQPLRALLAVIEAELERVESDIASLTYVEPARPQTTQVILYVLRSRFGISALQRVRVSHSIPTT